MKSLRNVYVIDPADARWEPFTAGRIIPALHQVITTPSSVAVDAARAERPVAVVGYELALPLYEPLPILRSREDWLRFVDNEADDLECQVSRSVFLRRAVLPGHGAARILNEILTRTDKNVPA